MSALSGIQGGSGLVSGGSAYSALSSGDFLKIIFTELSKQDPLQPNDSKALLEQLSSIRSIQADLDLSDRLQTLVAQNELTSASGLIGRRIGGLSEDRQRVSGVVQSLSRTSDGVILALPGGVRVPMSGVDEIALDAGNGAPGGDS